jgi:HAD superfamily hydrolase (TIGR01509 family)
MSRYQAVILDVDGTLIFSNELHARAWVDALAETGREADLDRVVRLIGMGGDKVLPELTGLEEESDEGARILERRGEIFKKRYLEQVRPVPGVRDLLLRLREMGMHLVVATSAGEPMLKPLLDAAGVRDLIEDATSSSDAEASKPDPDIVAAALEKVDAPTDRVVMLADTPYDLEACERLGLDMIAFRTGGWTDRDFPGAIAIYEDAAELLEQLEDSPLGDRAA